MLDNDFENASKMNRSSITQAWNNNINNNNNNCQYCCTLTHPLQFFEESVLQVELIPRKEKSFAAIHEGHQRILLPWVYLPFSSSQIAS